TVWKLAEWVSDCMGDAVMWTWKDLSKIIAFAVVPLSAAMGCTISIQPWTRHAATAPAPDAPPGSAGFKAPMPNPYPPGNLPSPYPPNAYPPNAYPPGAYAPNPAGGNESMAQLIKQLNEAEDQRKVLSDQVYSLKKQARERDDNLQHASFEMEESTKHLR